MTHPGYVGVLRIGESLNGSSNDSGEDWQLAMSQGKSPLHILEPTGLQLQLKQSIVKKDAYLPRYTPPYLCVILDRCSDQ